MPRDLHVPLVPQLAPEGAALSEVRRRTSAERSGPRKAANDLPDTRGTMWARSVKNQEPRANDDCLSVAGTPRLAAREVITGDDSERVGSQGPGSTIAWPSRSGPDIPN